MRASRFGALCSVILTKKMEVKSRRSVFTKGVAAAHPVVVELFDVDVPQGSETLRLLEIRETLKARRIYERSAALLRLADVLFSDFDKRKREHAGLDFDDLIQTAGRLLTRRYAAEWVLWKLDGGISHILLDEAQDTSPPQWRILSALTDDIFAGAGSVRRAEAHAVRRRRPEAVDLFLPGRGPGALPRPDAEFRIPRAHCRHRLHPAQPRHVVPLGAGDSELRG